MGRTGRKRAGRIIILLTEGKEEMAYNASLKQKSNIYKIITNGSKNFRFYENNPLMIPIECKPKVHKIHISAPVVQEVEPKVCFKSCEISLTIN